MLKLQYFGHLMWRANSSLMLGKTEGRRRRGQQSTRWSNSITDSMDMSLSKLQERVKNTGAWCAAAHGVTKGWTWFRNRTTASQKTEARSGYHQRVAPQLWPPPQLELRRESSCPSCRWAQPLLRTSPNPTILKDSAPPPTHSPTQRGTSALPWPATRHWLLSSIPKRTSQMPPSFTFQQLPLGSESLKDWGHFFHCLLCCT